MSDPVVVLCTIETREAAERLAESVVEDRLAACVNVIGGVVSIFRWEERVERQEECLLVAKTTSDRFEALREALVARHGYEVPEVLALGVVGSHRPYLDWLDAAVRR